MYLIPFQSTELFVFGLVKFKTLDFKNLPFSKRIFHYLDLALNLFELSCLRISLANWGFSILFQANFAVYL